MRKPCPVFDGEWGADRLAELGLKAEILEFALRGADAEARTHTELDPPNMQGMARYSRTVRLLQRVKELDPLMFTKSGIMVGLGEQRNEILQVMDDLRSAEVDFLTIGQYLQPTRKHHAVERFVPPDEFKAFETIAYAKGFLMVASSPLTRSSHHAGEDFARLKAARDARGR